jgi:RAB6A-GEF complex partner protein 2
MENLAWASVQINGYCKTQEFKVPLPNQPLTLPKTSLNVHENSFLATDPKILFCDLRLANGESRTCKNASFECEFYLTIAILSVDYYREQIPSCPPTYRGVDIKYYYKVSVSTQRVGSRVQLLQVPIRVLPLLIEDKPDQQLPAPCDVTNDELTPTNPFLENDRKVVSKVEIALENLQNITARRRPNFYVITNRRGKVGRFCLFKPCYKLGEDIIGTLDFSCRTIRCVQLSVTLQCEEILTSKLNKTPPESKEVAKESTGKITNFTKHHEICIGLLQTQMILPIPLHVTPSFSTELVDVRWRLHFQFVTTTSEDLMPVEGPDGDTWHGPKNIDIETMVWNLPITIYATSPTQIFHPSLGEELTLR